MTMKIVSLFSDYYDGATSPKLGGVHEDITRDVTYRRDRIPVADNIVGSHLRSVFKVPGVQLHNDHLTSGTVISSKYKWLCVCGRVFMLVPHKVGQDEFWRIVSATHSPKQYKELTRNRWFVFSGTHVDEVVGFTDPDILGLSVLLKSPVFIISKVLPNKSSFEVHVEIEIPRLAATGVSEFYDDRMLYLDIASFLSKLQTDWKML